jgi:hypothetical protein
MNARNLVTRFLTPASLHAALVAAQSAALIASPAQAQSAAVYRCGQTYQQLPCDRAQPVDVKDDRSRSQHQDAKEAATAERRLAKDLAAERRERDKSIKPQTEPLGIGLRPDEQPASAAAAGAKPHGKKKPRKGQADDEPKRYRAPPPPAASK